MTSPRTSTTAPTATRPFWLVVAIFLIIELTPIFEVTMMYTALPTLMKVFDADAASVSWVITIFLLVGAGTAAIAGKLGDTYGRKRVLIGLMIVSAVGSIISVIAGNLEGILVGRALQGTSAGLFPLLMGIAREVAPAPKVPLLICLTSGIGLIGGSVGAVAAGLLLDNSGWHSMFIASAALAVVAVLVALILPRSIATGGTGGRIDFLGGILMAPAIAAILFGFTIARSTGFTGLVIGLIIAGAVLFGFWILWELKVKEPMFNLRLFARPDLVKTLVATALVSAGALSAPGLLTPLLQQTPADMPVGLGLTATQAGLYGLISGVIAFALSPLIGKLAGRLGGRTTLLIGASVSAVGYAGYLISTHSLPLSIVALVIGSVGTACITISVPIVIIEIVAAHETSEAVGLVFTVGRTVFSAVGTALLGIVLASSTVADTTYPTLFSWNIAVILVVVAGAGAFATVLAIRKAMPMDARGEIVEAVAEVEPAFGEDAPEAEPRRARA